MAKAKTTPLLELLGQRKAWELSPFRPPHARHLRHGEAVEAFAANNPSDPFAAARIHKDMLRGLADASEVLKDAGIRTRAAV